MFPNVNIHEQIWGRLLFSLWRTFKQHYWWRFIWDFISLVDNFISWFWINIFIWWLLFTYCWEWLIEGCYFFEVWKFIGKNFKSWFSRRLSTLFLRVSDYIQIFLKCKFCFWWTTYFFIRLLEKLIWLYFIITLKRFLSVWGRKLHWLLLQFLIFLLDDIFLKFTVCCLWNFCILLIRTYKLSFWWCFHFWVNNLI